MNGDLTWRQAAVLLTLSALVAGAVWGASTTFEFKSDHIRDLQRIEGQLSGMDAKLDRLLRRPR